MSVNGLLARFGCSVSVERAVKVQNATGSSRDAWVTHGDAFTAWLQPASTQLIEAYGARNMVITHRLYASVDPGVREGDRITAGDETYLVVGLSMDQAGVNRLWRVDVKQHG